MSAEVWKFAPAYELPRWPFVRAARARVGRAKPPSGRHRRRRPGRPDARLRPGAARRRASVLLDEDDTVGVRGASSRGICYAQKSLEIFDRLGIYERIRAKGITWSVGRTFSGADEVYAFNLKDESLSEQPPFINLQQFYLEWFLVDRIRELGARGDLRWKSRVTQVEHRRCTDAARSSTSRRRPARYALEADWFIDATGANSPIREAHGPRRCNASRSTDRWCITDVRFKKPFAVERWTWIDAPFNEGRAVWQHLMADERLAPRLPDGRGRRHRDDQPARGRRRAAARAARRRRRVRVRLDRPVRLPRPPARDLPRRPHALHRRRGARRLPVRRARRQQRHPGRRQPRLEARARRAGPARPRRWSTATTPSATPRRSRTCASPAARRASSRRAAPHEHRMRRAVVALARTHEFARRLANTGRMAQANAYPPSPWAPTGARSLQNVAVDATTVMRLLAGGTRFLGLWIGASAADARDARRPRGELAAAGRGRAPPTATSRASSASGAGTLVLVRPDAYVAAELRAAHAGRRRGGACSGDVDGRRSVMKTESNIADPDGFYEAWIAAHRASRKAPSADLDARLVLLLANQVGDMAGAARVHRGGAPRRRLSGGSPPRHLAFFAPSSALRARARQSSHRGMSPRRGERTCGKGVGRSGSKRCGRGSHAACGR